MRTLLALTLALSALSAHAQLYKWVDANGKAHFSDQPPNGVEATEVQVQRAQTASVPFKDDWRERERLSREKRAGQSVIDRRAALAEAAERRKQEPFNPSANRSNNAMTEEEMCRRDRQQIEYAEKTKDLAIRHGHNMPQRLTEEQRQEVVRERKANHELTCASGRRR